MRYIQAITEEHSVDGSWDPEDKWDRPDTEMTFHGLEVGVTDEKYPPYDAVEVGFGGLAHVVVCSYNSGDTFGSDHGRIQLMGAFQTEQEAESLIAAAKNLTGKVKGGITTEFNFNYEGETYYRPWVGYFESLNDLTIETIMVPEEDEL